MADENIKVKVNFEAKTGEIRRAIAELGILEKRVKRLASGREQAFAERTARNLTNVTKSWRRSFDFIDAGAKMAGKALTKFLGLAIKGVIIEMAALGAAMIATHALFAAGNLLVKAYRGAMQLLAGAAAAATVAIAAASAAIREQQAAIFAYRGKGAPAFGSAMNQTRMAMRNLQSDASLATLGVEALNKAYGNMSKSMTTSQINQSNDAIKALMDFGSAGQDPAKGLEQVSIVIAALSDKKKGISDVITEAKKLGPEMEKALKTANVKTKKQFQELLMSGQLAKEGGVSGQFDAINNTLIGQLKSYFTRIRGEFADFGDQFLEPLKVAFENVFNTVRRDLQRVMGTIMYSFGSDGLIDGFQSAIEKTSDWMVRMIREYLPKAIGMFDRMGDWFNQFKRGWNLVLDQTRPLIDGAKVLYKAWDPVWEAIKRGSDNLFLFRSLLIENSDDVQEFGERVGQLIDTLSKFFMNLKKMFADMAPFINDLVRGLTEVFSMLTGMLTIGAGGGLATALAPLLGAGILGRGMSSVKGRLMPQQKHMTQNMQVTATNVNIANAAGPINGRTTNRAGGPLGPVPPMYYPSGGRMSSGRLPSGAAITGAPGIIGMPPGSVYGPSSLLPPGRISQLQLDPNRTFRESSLLGSRMIVRGSDIEQRRRENLQARMATGRGLGYAMFGQPRDPYASMGKQMVPGPDGTMMEVDKNPRFNLAQSARFRASQSLNARSMDELHEIATTKGITLTRESKREDIVNQILRKRGSVAEFKNDERRVGLIEGGKNDLRRVGLVGQRVADRTQYGIRRGIGAARGGMQYLKSGAFDAESGEDFEIKSQQDELKAKRDRILQQRGGRLSRINAQVGYMRDMGRISRSQSKFGNAYNNKFAKSMTGRMGAGMGLGMLSQVAPEEMRGAMALGGAVAQFDPRLGIAVAGIGGALKAQGAMKGALSGAAGGAALGGMFGPQGAAIGAGIGLLVGGIMGAVNKGKQQLKEARATVQESLGRFYMDTMKASGNQFEQNRKILERGGSLEGKRGALQGSGAKFAASQAKVRSSMEAAIAAGGGSYQVGGTTEFFDAKKILDEYYKTEEGAKITEAERKKQKKRATNTIREYLKQTSPEVQAQLQEIDKVNNDRLAALSRATGKSGAELEQLAKDMGVNLYDATVKYDDLVKKFTSNLKKSGEQLNASMTDIFLGAANPFQKKREAQESQYALNQNFRQIGDVLRGGGSEATKMGAVDKGMEQAYAQILGVAGGDAFKAFDIYNKMFFSGKNEGIFAEGAEFAGQSQMFLGNETFMAADKQMRQGVSGEAATQIRALLAEKNMSVDAGLLEASIANMSNEEVSALLANLKTMDQDTTVAKFGETNEIKQALAGGTGTEVERLLKEKVGLEGIDIKTENKESLDKIATAATDFSTAADGLKTAVETFNTNMEGFFTAPLGEMPDWWAKGLKITGSGDDMRLAPGDTSTPRAGGIGDTTASKLSQTMARHAAMNSQLTGKRIVTSSLRDYALGSPSSDHATGSAYDLVGQNLGQYAKLVHANGGFAEFHGSMANRHLHVVPGPGIGDTATVRPVSSVSSNSGGTTNYYSFEINGANASPEAIANMVMAKIEAKERSNRERR